MNQVLPFPSPPPSANAAVKTQRLWIATLKEFQELAVAQVATARRPVTGDIRRCLVNELAKDIRAEEAELTRLEDESRALAKAARTARLEAQQETI